jgi:membrane-bound ClpP family serine protease
MMYLAIALFILGLSLLIAELLMPGFGIPGIIGIISLIISVMLTILVSPIYGIYIAIGIIGVVMLVCIILRRWMINKQIYNKIILDEVLQVEKPEYEDLEYFLGKEGITLTPLKPCGTVDFKGVRIETFSVGPYIGANHKVKVVEIANQKIIVQQVTETEQNSN